MITSMLSIYCGIFFITDLPEKWVKENPDYASGSVILDENTKLAFFVVIVVSNIVFFIYWSIKMLDEILEKIRKSLPKIYLYLCACGNKHKMNR